MFIFQNITAMKQIISEKIQNRAQAGVLLGMRLIHVDSANTVVVGIPKGGALVAGSMAEFLGLPLELLPCKELRTYETGKSYGWVCANETLIKEKPRELPNDFLYYQTLRQQTEINYENHYYYGESGSANFRFKTVILVDDMLSSPDRLMVCIKEVARQRPMKIIVAVPFIEAEAGRIIRSMCDELVFIRMHLFIDSPKDYYQEYGVITDSMVRETFNHARSRVSGMLVE